jgi:chromatin modification-related protein EAF6
MSASSSSLQGLLAQKAQLDHELREIEAEIMNLEGSYLEDTASTGNIVKGWDGYFHSGPQQRGTQRAIKIKNAERVFSCSSQTAPLAPDEDEEPPANDKAAAASNTRKDTQKNRRDKRGDQGRAKLGRKKRNDDDFDDDDEV